MYLKTDKQSNIRYPVTRFFMCDFETSQNYSSDTPGANNKLDLLSWVYLAGIQEFTKTTIYQPVFLFGNETKNDRYYVIKKFIAFFNAIPENCQLWFHNLNFDISFILDYLFSRGAKLAPTGNIKIFLQANRILTATIPIRKPYNCHFNCSWKMTGMGLIKQKEDEARYQANKYVPEKSDYEVYMTDEFNQITPLVQELYFNQSFTQLTFGSFAYQQFRKNLKPIYQKLITSSNIRKYLVQTEPQWGRNCLGIIPIKQSVFSLLSKAYRGGVTQINPCYASKLLPEVICYDVNSMYPGVMIDFPYPVGKPIPFEGEGLDYTSDKYLKVYEVWLKQVRLKGLREVNGKFYYDKYKPTLPLGHNIWVIGNNFFLQSTGVIDYDIKWLTDVDLELVKKYYDCKEIIYLRGFAFQKVDDLFTSFINKWHAIKQNPSSIGEKVVAKLCLNSLYGKFGTNPLQEKYEIRYVTKKIIGKKYPLNRLNKEIIINLMKNGRMQVFEEITSYYLPIAIYVTAYARKYLMETINDNWQYFVYADTDSVYLIKNSAVNLRIGVGLGYWQPESVDGRFVNPFYGVRPKTYQWGSKKRFAGIDRFYLSALDYGSLTSKQSVLSQAKKIFQRCPGGIMVFKGDYTLNV